MAVHQSQTTDILRNIMQNVELRTKRRHENEFQEKLHEIQVSFKICIRNEANFLVGTKFTLGPNLVPFGIVWRRSKKFWQASGEKDPIKLKICKFGGATAHNHRFWASWRTRKGNSGFYSGLQKEAARKVQRADRCFRGLGHCRLWSWPVWRPNVSNNY